MEIVPGTRGENNDYGTCRYYPDGADDNYVILIHQANPLKMNVRTDRVEPEPIQTSRRGPMVSNMGVDLGSEEESEESVQPGNPVVLLYAEMGDLPCRHPGLVDVSAVR